MSKNIDKNNEKNKTKIEQSNMFTITSRNEMKSKCVMFGESKNKKGHYLLYLRNI